MVDTGSNKNYIHPKLVRKPIPNQDIFFANSIGGKVEIRFHTNVLLFGLDTPIKFFLLPKLTTFHGILGNDTLKDLDAIIHPKFNYMTIGNNNKKITLKELPAESINNTSLRTNHMTKIQQGKLKEIVSNHSNLFSAPNEKLTYTTRITGEIRTLSENPIYSKTYPYPMSLKKEVEAQIQDLLKDGIIRPSKSPYNSPVWVVPKKLDASGVKKYRMVVDYRKLNSITIADKYPIPEINEVLAQLGKSKYFTVLDLKSGFHQIPLRQKDIEKTAFSVNNGKYEFTRLPFGLKNAPSIFQRALDDILRSHIGERCYVYIDDIIIFSPNEEQHFNDINEVFRTLNEANMKVQLDKSEFFKDEVEFLGFLITRKGIQTNPKKVESIVNFPYPRTLKDLRSFLGLAGYYRRFVKDFAKIAKPLTTLLRGEDGRVSKNLSSKKTIDLDESAKAAFNKIKEILSSRDVILTYPDFSKSFELTTDASNYAIGAVLSQENRPITFISRSLSKTEESYAANEREMLAIIWSLDSLRNYLYGRAKVIIYTDHQPLTHALSNKNNNSKMKRWKAILEEYNYELQYKPGRSNVVADALSRPPTTEINTLTATLHSDESSSENLIPTAECPINVFKNQIFILLGETNEYQFKLPFPTYHRHIVRAPTFSENDLLEILKRYLNPSVINGIFTCEPLMGMIQTFYPLHFKNYKVRYTQTQVEDLSDPIRQEEEILKVHKRAHRNEKENKLQLLEKYYFPKMSNRINSIIAQCKVCKEGKYDRHPNKSHLSSTPIPKYAGEIVHIDIWSTEKHLTLTAIDKLTKYAQAQVIKSRSIADIREPLRKILFNFGVPKIVVIDNEKALNSASITFMIQDQLNIEIFKTPPYKSTVNGQVERFHSTLAEIMRCLKTEKIHRNYEELLDRSVYEYNCSIHSTTGKKPVELFFGRSVNVTPEQYEKARRENIEALVAKQSKDIEYHNKHRKPFKSYSPGQKIYVKINKRLGTKLSARYKEEIVKENRTNTVLTESNRIVHKDHIRN